MRRALLVLLALLLFDVSTVLADPPPPPLTPDSALVVPAGKDTLPGVYADNTKDPMLDTLAVYLGVWEVRRIAVNRYFRIYRTTHFPLRKYYDIGYWSMRYLTGRRSDPDVSDVGVWINLASIPQKVEISFRLFGRDGSYAVVVPSDP